MGFTTFWDKLFNPQKNTHEESRENAHIPTAEATTGCDVYDENGHHITARSTIAVASIG